MNEFATTAMWAEATADHDAEQRRGLVVSAKVALAGTWPFLAAANSEEEFEHRLALMADTIKSQTPPEVLGEVVAGLRSDFAEISVQRAAQREQERTAALTVTAATHPRGETPNAYVHVHKHGSGDDEYHQIDHVASPTWVKTLGRESKREDALQKAREFGLPVGLPIFENGIYVEGHKLPQVSAGQEFFNTESGRWEKVATNYQPDPDRAWRYHYGPEPIAAQNPPAAGGGVTGPVPGQPQVAYPYSGGDANTSIDPADGFPRDVSQGEGRSQIGYANQLTPGQWVVPPDAGWRDATRPNAATGLPQGQWPSENSAAGWASQPPMKTSHRRVATEGAVPTPGPNPDYFSQGTQGLQGPPTFPQDPAGGEEPHVGPIDTFYGEVPPQPSSGSAQGQVDGQGYSRMAAVTRFEPGYPHVTIHPEQIYQTEEGHPFGLHEVRLHESPHSSFTVGHWPSESVNEEARGYARSYMSSNGHYGRDVPVHWVAGHVASRRTAEYHYIRKNSDGKYEVWQKGTGKTLSTHDTKEDAEASFRAMMESKHGSRLGFSRSAGKRATVQVVGELRDKEDPSVLLCPNCGGELDGDEYGRRYCPHCSPGGAGRYRKPLFPPPGSERTAAAEHLAPYRIVGHCDNCGVPVRWNEAAGQLEHLHNRDNACGKPTRKTAARMQVLQLQHSNHRCVVDDKPATHLVRSISEMGNGTRDIGPVCAEHAQQAAMNGHIGSRQPQFFDPTLQRTAEVTLQAPTPENPTGRGSDEYRARTWDALVKQRPMQTAEERDINTPQLPAPPLQTRQINTPTPGLGDEQGGTREDDDEDEDAD